MNNVGTNIRRPTTEYTEEDLKSLMTTNLYSMFELTKQLYPALKRSSDGEPASSVVNIGSVAGVTCMKR